MKKILVLVIAIALIGALASAIDSSKRKKRAPSQNQDRNAIVSTSTNSTPKPPANKAGNSSKLFLKIGFEDEYVIPSATLKSNFDKLHIVHSQKGEGDIPIQYEGGVESDRYARIISDPTEVGNHILHYWLKNATIPTGFKGDYAYKGRIQLNLYDISYTSASVRYRMYLHPDLKFYKSYPEENAWFTISELWFRSPGGNNFRIPLNLVKEKGQNKPLYFAVSGDASKGSRDGKDGTWKSVWGEANTKFDVPIGEWVEMEVGYKQGDKGTGRFYLAVKRASDSGMVTVFDIINWTYNPDAQTPVPLTGWNPLKLYTSGKVIKHITRSGGVAQVYWDDFEFFDRWQN